MKDDIILKKLRSGDPKGLEQLMDQYMRYVSAVAWNILRSFLPPEDAEEVVSDVFLAAWEGAGDIQPGKLKPWLAAVARNKARDRLRSLHIDLPLEEDVLELPDEDTPVISFERKEEQALVRRAVETLGEPDQEIFLRHYYYIQSVREISQVMCLNESTVKTRLRRGRMRLKEILTRWDVL